MPALGMAHSTSAIELQSLLKSSDFHATGISAFQPIQLYDDKPIPPWSRCIRLLKLDYDPETPEAPLSGTMQVADLQSCASFTALSYVWGEYSTPKDTISCEGCHLEITSNCRDALLALRKLFGRIIIWVDAICINQNDIEEKAAQIQLTEEIYSWAQAVYIWLGKDNEKASARRGIAFLKLAAQTRVLEPGLPWVNGRGGKTVFQDRLSLVIRLASFSYIKIPYGSLSRIKNRSIAMFNSQDLEFLLNKDWLRRTWTLQEIILACNPILVAGENTIDWAIFHSGLHACFSTRSPPFTPLSLQAKESYLAWLSLFIFWLNVSRPSRCNWTRLRDSPKEIDCSILEYQKDFVGEPSLSQVASQVIVYLPIVLGTIWLFIASFYLHLSTFVVLLPYATVLFWLWRLKMNLTDPLIVYPSMNMNSITKKEAFCLSLMHALRRREASKAEDKSFALNGILRRTMDQLPSKPDYTKPCGHVYRDLFTDLLSWCPSSIELLADAGSSFEDTPSWVPDWRDTNSRRLPITRDFAFGNLRPRMALSDNILKVEAAIKGAVSYCSNMPLGNNATDRETMLWSANASLDFARWLEVIFNNFKSNNGRSESLTASISYAILGNTKMAQQAVGTESGRRFDEMFSRHREELHSGQQAQVSHESEDAERGGELQPFIRDLSEALQTHERSSSEALQQFLAKHPIGAKIGPIISQRLGERRRLFFAPNNYVGSGPLNVRVGDKIALIEGVSVPMILRVVAGSPSRFSVVGPALVSGCAGGPSYVGETLSQTELV